MPHALTLTLNVVTNITSLYSEARVEAAPVGIVALIKHSLRLFQMLGIVDRAPRERQHSSCSFALVFAFDS